MDALRHCISSYCCCSAGWPCFGKTYIPEMLRECAAAISRFILTMPIALSHITKYCLCLIAVLLFVYKTVSPYLDAEFIESRLIDLSWPVSSSLVESSLVWRNTATDRRLLGRRCVPSSAQPASDSLSPHPRPYLLPLSPPSFPH